MKNIAVLSRQHWVITITLCAAASLSAQEARLTGAVTDQSGGVVANAKVSATQSGRNQTFNTVSSAEGRYQFPRLPIGLYRIHAESPGFKSFLQSDVNLTTNADLL